MHSIAEQLSSMGEYQKAHDQFVKVLGSLRQRECVKKMRETDFKNGRV